MLGLVFLKIRNGRFELRKYCICEVSIRSSVNLFLVKSFLLAPYLLPFDFNFQQIVNVRVNYFNFFKFSKFCFEFVRSLDFS